MSKFIRNIALFIAGIPLVSTKALATPESRQSIQPVDGDLPTSLRPLNREMDNLFAGHSSHSSHSSHASHSSHYSGSGGYSSGYTPSYTPSLPSPMVAPTLAPTPAPVAPTPPQLTRTEKLRLQVIRVQIRLNGLGLYNGPINGIFDDETKEALKLFQKVKELPEDGFMTTATLNALGVPASN